MIFHGCENKLQAHKAGGRLALRSFNKLKAGLEKFESFLKLSKHKINSFRPRISFRTEGGPYLCRTAEDVEDLISCLKLRYTVFHSELLQRKATEEGLDVDAMDVHCDHLMILEKGSGRLVGTYRIASTHYTSKFYSQGEFELEDLLAADGEKIELGRACIHKEHRNGMVMQLLWRGIAEYFKATRSRFLFGCTSIKTTDVDHAVLLAAYAQHKGWVEERFRVRPTEEFRMPEFLKRYEAARLDFEDKELQQQVADLLPALMLSYIRAGAKVVLEPALDKDFECLDFLTILDLEELSPVHRKKFVESAGAER